MPTSKDATAALRLLNLADAGAFEAPTDLLNLRARIQRLAEMQSELAPIPTHVRRDILGEVMRRTLTGDKVDLRGYGQRLDQAVQLERARGQAASILLSAREQSEAEMVTDIRDRSGQILRPVERPPARAAAVVPQGRRGLLRLRGHARLGAAEGEAGGAGRRYSPGQLRRPDVDHQGRPGHFVLAFQ